MSVAVRFNAEHDGLRLVLRVTNNNNALLGGKFLKRVPLREPALAAKFCDGFKLLSADLHSVEGKHNDRAGRTTLR